MNVHTKQKQTNRHRKQPCCYQKGEEQEKGYEIKRHKLLHVK